jgi:hypothetical protein
VDYFYAAAKRRSQGALWPIFAPALTPISWLVGEGGHERWSRRGTGEIIAPGDFYYSSIWNMPEQQF